MKSKAKRICASPDCKKEFPPRVRTQRFCSKTCSNRESQRIYREQQKEQATA